MGFVFRERESWQSAAAVCVECLMASEVRAGINVFQILLLNEQSVGFA